VNAKQLPDADDFRALSNDVRKRRESAKPPAVQSIPMTPEHVPYGCGPGVAVAEGTPQDGVRSVLMREIAKLDQELWVMICQAHIHPRRTPDDYTKLGRLAQGIADRAHLISGKVNV